MFSKLCRGKVICENLETPHRSVPCRMVREYHHYYAVIAVHLVGFQLLVSHSYLHQIVHVRQSLCGCFQYHTNNVLSGVRDIAKEDTFPRVWDIFGSPPLCRSHPYSTSKGSNMSEVFFTASTKLERRFSSVSLWYCIRYS